MPEARTGGGGRKQADGRESTGLWAGKGKNGAAQQSYRWETLGGQARRRRSGETCSGIILQIKCCQ